MQLPFTVEQFFGVFRAYNGAVWPAQILLLVLAALVVIFIALRRSWSGVAVSAILAVLWIWLGAAYHLAFFARINPVAYGFGALSIVGGLMFAWHGVIRRHLEFSLGKSLHAGIGIALLVFALLVYPIWATLAGHGYPELPTFGLPCPTTIFTIGVLALASGTSVRAVFTVTILWSVARKASRSPTAAANTLTNCKSRRHRLAGGWHLDRVIRPQLRSCFVFCAA
jgi:hypothetical protein